MTEGETTIKFQKFPEPAGAWSSRYEVWKIDTAEKLPKIAYEIVEQELIKIRQREGQAGISFDDIHKIVNLVVEKVVEALK